MSVIYVILCFILGCLVLVHINLHQRKNELFNFIMSSTKTVMTRHKKINKILKYLKGNEFAQEIKTFNDETMQQISENSLSPSKLIKVEILLEEKMKTLLNSLDSESISEQLAEAIESYNITQKKVNKNKKKYNKMMTKFLEACNLKPANLFISWEKIDSDFEAIEQNDNE